MTWIFLEIYFNIGREILYFYKKWKNMIVKASSIMIRIFCTKQSLYVISSQFLPQMSLVWSRYLEVPRRYLKAPCHVIVQGTLTDYVNNYKFPRHLGTRWNEGTLRYLEAIFSQGTLVNDDWKMPQGTLCLQGTLRRLFFKVPFFKVPFFQGASRRPQGTLEKTRRL